jgi:hypothetical protein
MALSRDSPESKSKLLAAMRALPYITSLLCLAYDCHASPVSLKAVDGRSVTATVNGIEGEDVLITKLDGGSHRVPLEKLDAASKETVAAEITKITKHYEQLKKTLELPDPEYAKKDIDNAYYTSRNFIKIALKSPSTAKFSNPVLDKGTTGSVVTNEGRIESTGFVDAQNSFGAALRENWKVVVQPEGEQWRIVHAVLGGKVLMDTRKNHKTPKILKVESLIGITKAGMVAVLGQPTETKRGSNTDDGDYSIYSYSNDKGVYITLTIWDSDGDISSGCYRGTYFSK